jgi:opacity protein-like surface antigen
MRTVVIAVCVLLATITAASAEVRSGAYTLTPMIGYQGYDNDLDLDDGLLYGLAIGGNLSSNLGVELDLRYASVDSDIAGGSDVDVRSATLNLLYHFRPQSSFVPYLLAGIGGLQYEVDDNRNDDFIANWGGGFKLAVARDIDLRLDLRHTIDFRTVGGDGDDVDGSDVVNNVAAMIGVNIQFGHD